MNECSFIIPFFHIVYGKGNQKMDTVLAPPAETFFLSIPAPVIYTIIPVVAIVVFLYMYKF